MDGTKYQFLIFIKNIRQIIIKTLIMIFFLSSQNILLYGGVCIGIKETDQREGQVLQVPDQGEGQAVDVPVQGDIEPRESPENGDDNSLKLKRVIKKYTNGKLEYEGYEHNGKRQSKWVFYYENGKTKETGYYKDDIRIGVWFYWDVNGKKSQIDHDATNKSANKSHKD